MSQTCYRCVKAQLELNPDREYTITQMRDHLLDRQVKYSHSMIGWAFRQLHNDGTADRVREGNHPFRYTLTRS